jgi:hypothetical protein
LGEVGDYNAYQKRRTSQPRPGGVNERWYVMNDRAGYKNKLTLAADPNYWFRRRLAEVEQSPFFSVKQPALAAERSTPDMRLELDWQGKRHALQFPENAMPPWFKELIDKVFPNFISYYAQLAPTFWAEDDAVLWVAQRQNAGSDTTKTGLILYRSGVAKMFGWHLLDDDKAYREVSMQLGKERVEAIFAGLDTGRSSLFSDPFQSPVISTSRNDTRNSDMLIYKPNPGAMRVVGSDTWRNLRVVWCEMLSQFGPVDTVSAAICSRA